MLLGCMLWQGVCMWVYVVYEAGQGGLLLMLLLRAGQRDTWQQMASSQVVLLGVQQHAAYQGRRCSG